MNVKRLKDFQNMSSPELDLIVDYIKEIVEAREWTLKKGD
jgi:hypothetical protein